MASDQPGTPANDEQRRVSPQELAVALAAYRELVAANPQMVEYAVASAVAAVRPLLEAGARADERRKIADAIAGQTANYPEDVFPPDSTSIDGISGTAFRKAYSVMARRVRDGDL